MTDVVIRRAGSASDWASVRRICRETGPDGYAADDELWIGPYQRFFPEWAYVAELGGEVRGYLTGCPETAAFVPRAPEIFATPELAFGSAKLDGIYARHPAHLHMNLDEAARGRGTGRLLIERFAADLAAARVAGIHLFCGDGPLGFYEKVGFTRIDTGRSKRGNAVHALARHLP